MDERLKQIFELCEYCIKKWNNSSNPFSNKIIGDFNKIKNLTKKQGYFLS